MLQKLCTMVHSGPGSMGEQSRYSIDCKTQTVKLGQLTMRKNPHTPGHAANPDLSCLLGHSGPIVLEPFWCFSGVSQISNLLNVSLDMKNTLEMVFSACCTSVWRMSRISSTSISKRRPTVLVGGINCAVESDSMVEMAMSDCSPYAQSRT